MTESLAGIFASAVTRFPNRSFLRWIVDGKELRLTYGQMAVRVAATLEKLKALSPGDRVVSYLDDLVPSISFMLAAAHAGLVVVPMSAGFSVQALRRLIARLEAKALFTSEEMAPSLTGLDLPRYAYVSAPTRADVDRPLPLSGDLSEGDAALILRSAADARRADDPAFILPTSGTTGEPKLVVVSHRTAISDGNAIALGAKAEDEPPQRVLLALTITHGAGLFIVHMAIGAAGELCIPSRINTETPLPEVRRLDPTRMVLAPRILRALYRQHVAGGDAGSRMFGAGLEVLVIGGSATEPELLRHVADQGVTVVEGYGASESGIIALTPKGGWREGYVGKPLPGVRLRIADDGELLAKPAAPMIEYLHDPALTREAFTDDGYYRTGDFGEISGDGYLRVLGRKREVFNTFEGSNIYPARIEVLLEALPWVKEVVLVGDQRPHLGALIVVNDAPSDGGPPDGYLECGAHPTLYERARRDIQKINLPQEGIERIRRMALFARRFPPALYTPTQIGKTRRDRRRIDEVYASRIAAFYTAEATPDATWILDE